jgi:GR25 family glycosyltransferase involved in LPS biosynthesis
MAHRIRVAVRRLDPFRRLTVFSSRKEKGTLQRIYVINLDRKPDRWKKMRAELSRFRGLHNERLTAIARRFSAIDARYMRSDSAPTGLDVTFTLAEQLAVHPNPLLEIDDTTRNITITMTRQEQAVALSHIEVWKLIANGDVPSALILEDDVVFAPGFAKGLTSVWSKLADSGFDLLYLAYRDVGLLKPQADKRPLRRDTPGIWEASGYVLTRVGAQKLIDALPVRGPVDLWLNMRFAEMEVYTSPRQLIEQRIDEPSTNSYSVLPVLSQVGAITREKPLLMSARTLPGPIVAFGPAKSGLSSLAEALSMLGYTCLSDVDEAGPEAQRLKRGESTSFNAFVNVGDLGESMITEIAAKNRRALFITTRSSTDMPEVPTRRLLSLPASMADKWNALATFLEIEYPPFDYPDIEDIGRRVRMSNFEDLKASFKNQKWDRSPWIKEGDYRWPGVPLTVLNTKISRTRAVIWNPASPLNRALLQLREDTFPSNLALFSPTNAIYQPDKSLELILTADSTHVRDFTAAAIASTKSYLYGTFAATLQPTNASGLITGLFLHRNGPRQEIDIEFLGKDTTKMLVNVFFNPGPEGAKLEYGYRGTPTLVDLGFDASLAPHLYEIEWLPNQIIWRVDGKVVYRRFEWGPTPIPDQPLEFNINLWHSRSVEFSGKLDVTKLPARTSITSVEIISYDEERC